MSPERDERGRFVKSPPPAPPPPTTASYWRAIVGALVALVIAGAAVSVAVVSDDDGKGHKKREVTFKVDSADKDTKPDKTITLDETGQSVVAEQKADVSQGAPEDAEAKLHEHRLPPPQVEAKAKAIQPPAQPAIPTNVPLASVTQPGCTSAFVRNKSPRKVGAPVLFGFVHWTGSAITAGPQGGLGIVRWFDTPAAQASSNYITDQSGRCWYTVPETARAWTQANANEWSVSVEVINPGVLPLLRTTASRKAVIKLMIGWHRRWHIPYRMGIIRQGPNNSCVPVRSGFMAHRDAGPCGGGHPDVGVPSVVPSLIAEAKRLDSPVKPLSKSQQHACDVLNWHRHRAHVVGRWYPGRVKQALVWQRQIPAGRCPSKYR